MRRYRPYLILAALIAFVAYFGVYGFYVMLAGDIGEFWALAGSALIAAGTLVVAAVGITMIRSRPPEQDGEPDGR